MRTGLSHLTEDPRRGHVLIESHATPALRQWRNEMVKVLAALMTAQTAQLLGDTALSTTDTNLTSLTLVSGFLELLAAWLQQRVNAIEEHLIEFLTAMFITAMPTAAEAR